MPRLVFNIFYNPSIALDILKYAAVSAKDWLMPWHVASLSVMLVIYNFLAFHFSLCDNCRKVIPFVLFCLTSACDKHTKTFLFIVTWLQYCIIFALFRCFLFSFIFSESSILELFFFLYTYFVLLFVIFILLTVLPLNLPISFHHFLKCCIIP